MPFAVASAIVFAVGDDLANRYPCLDSRAFCSITFARYGQHSPSRMVTASAKNASLSLSPANGSNEASGNRLACRLS